MSTNLCEGCLSIERPLIFTPMQEFQSFFEDETDRVSLSLCWECSADRRRALRFKQRVRQATHTLRQLTNTPTRHDTPTMTPKKLIPQCLSTIRINKIQTTEHLDDVESHHAKFDFTFDHDIKVNSADHLEKVEIKAEYVDDTKYDFEQNDMMIVEDDSIFDQNDSEVHNDDLPLIMLAKKEKYTVGKEKSARCVKKRTKCKLEDKLSKEKTPPKRPKKKRPVGNAVPLDRDKVQILELTLADVQAERERLLRDGVLDRFLYKCHDCILGYDYEHKYKNHMKKHDALSGVRLCPVCRIYTRDAYALTTHMRTHTLRYRCMRCDKLTVHKGAMLEHYAVAHEGLVRQLECEQCGYISTTKRRHRYHLLTHKQRPACVTCGKDFCDNNTLREHALIHEGIKQHACPHCHKTFRMKITLKAHLLGHREPGDNAYYCAQCELYFKHHLSYKFHLRNNLKHIDPEKLKFACAACPKRFLTEKRLSSHVAVVHVKRTEHLCPQCDKAFCSRGNLRKHVRWTHERPPRERTNICHSCGKGFYTNQMLLTHIRTHTGERPFRCTRCPSAFSQSSALYNHNKRVHPAPTDKPPA